MESPHGHSYFPHNPQLWNTAQQHAAAAAAVYNMHAIQQQHQQQHQHHQQQHAAAAAAAAVSFNFSSPMHPGVGVAGVEMKEMTNANNVAATMHTWNPPVANPAAAAFARGLNPSLNPALLTRVEFATLPPLMTMPQAMPQQPPPPHPQPTPSPPLQALATANPALALAQPQSLAHTVVPPSLLLHAAAAAAASQDQSSQQAAAAAAAAAALAPHSLSPQEKAVRIAALLHEGELMRARNQHADAIQRYNSILFFDPLHIQALNFKGTSHKALKEIALATECYKRALAIAPNDWISNNNLGIIYKESELLEAAIEHYGAAITHGPVGCVAYENMSVAKTDLGTRLKLNGAIDQAVTLYLDALEYNRNYYPAYFNLGVIFSERGDFEQASRYYHLAVEKNPNYSEALCNLGVLKKNAGELVAAVEFYQKALRANQNFTIAANNLAIAFTDLGTQVKNEGRLDEGMQYYKKALFQNSKYPPAWYNLGVAYSEKMRSDDSKLCYEMATLFDPNCAEAFNNLGVIEKDRGNLEQAMQHYSHALTANPTFSQALNNCAVIYTMLGKLDQAYEFCARAIKANPMYAEAHNNLGVLKRDEGCIDEAIQSYLDCLAIDPLSRNAGQNRLLALNSLIRPHEPLENTMDHIWQAHQQWGTNFANHLSKDRYHSWTNPKHLNPSSGMPSRPLRIGYISADFFTHSVSYFIEAPLQYADRNRCFVICYANVARRDKKTQVLQNYAHAWRAIHDKSAKEVAELIRADQIDILVELTGHTAGNRLDVMALKPAPVQVTWIGYPNTTGLPTIDYRFCDGIVDPVNTTQKFSEKLIRLPGPFLCYSPPTDAPPVSDTPALSRGYVTFGSFNNLAKINNEVLDCWCAILMQVPTARMLIKCKPFASATVCTKMLQRFVERGIDSNRVDLVPLLPTTSEHLQTYSSVDISVDTFPYAGTTTTCEALYCGVPVVTYKREQHNNHAHNVGASLISRIAGASEVLIATSPQQYIATAVNLAYDLPRLQHLRKNLRPAMLKSSLCDGPNFVKQLEQVYEDIWKTYCNEPGPAAMVVASSPA